MFDKYFLKTQKLENKIAIPELTLTHFVPAQPAFEKRDRTHGEGTD